MPFCSECGTKYDGAPKFCASCGAPQGAGAAPAAAAPPPAYAPPPMPTESAGDVVLWEGESKSLTGIASGGKLTGRRYKLTATALHLAEGVFTTNAQEVPLWAVRDLDLKQSMKQKMLGIGDVIVKVEHSDFTGRASVDLLNIPNPAQVRDLIRQQAGRERLEHDRRRQTRYYGDR